MRFRAGPALARSPLPVTGTVLSTAVHLVLVLALILTATLWPSVKSKPYFVNLVPAIAAVGVPQGRTTAPTPPSRVVEPPPRVAEPPRPAKSAPPDLPQREARREMPARETPSLPEPARATRIVPSRAETKELPTPTTSGNPPRVAASTLPAREAAAPPPPPPVGQPSGSAQGVGPVTLNVSDFPYSWYLSAVHRKVSEKWEGRARDGQQPVAVFEIGRDGQVTRLAIETSSGNTVYDQAALRAIAEANPFPPLPEDFKKPWLRVHLGFNYAGSRS